MHAVEQGVDLRGVPLLAFGGAGPVHACGVAELLESSRVVFPVNASVLSAFGTLVSPVRIDLARSMVRDLERDRPGRARRRARRAARRGPTRAAGRGGSRRGRALPLRRRRPIRRAGQRGHGVAAADEANIDVWPATRRRAPRRVRVRVPADLWAHDPRRRPPGGDVAALGRVGRRPTSSRRRCRAGTGATPTGAARSCSSAASRAARRRRLRSD